MDIDFNVLLFGSAVFHRFCKDHYVRKGSLDNAVIISNDDNTKLYVDVDSQTVIVVTYDKGRWTLEEGPYFSLVKEADE